ncbi:MAG: YkgJ family cysteine cluster protein [Nitrospirae bacterium]|nr:YkgJ family cysteine cluster protein [Nitrospirota bacterium]
MKPQLQNEKERLCLSCMKCCREVIVYTHPVLYSCPAEMLVEFYQARGFSVTRLKEDAIILSFKHDCQHLTPAGCDIYDQRPEACRDYSGIEDFGDECLWSQLKKK